METGEERERRMIRQRITRLRTELSFRLSEQVASQQTETEVAEIRAELRDLGA